MRPLILHEEIEVDAPVHVVWVLFRDLEAWPRWNPVCLDAAWISGRPWANGSTFRMRLRIGGVALPFHVQVVEAAMPHAVAWSSTVLGVTGHRRFQFVSVGRTTVVGDTMTFSHPFLPLWLFYPRPLIRAMSRRWLRVLKAEIEEDGPRRSARARPGGA